MRKLHKASLLAGTVLVSSLIATPAFAQDAQADETAAEETSSMIFVTGSRIAQRSTQTAAPVAVVDAEEFRLSGAVNVESVINALPQAVPGTSAFSNNPGNGAATLNLRGLGETRSLVLVNGRRWVSFDANQVVDLNTIPAFLIESVDTVTGGASAVYGSDALAGVVNFRMKRVQGVEMGGQFGLTERGDGERYNLFGAIGTDFDEGRGNVTVFGEYFNRKGVFQGQRAFSENALGGETFGLPLQRFGSAATPTARIIVPGQVGIVDGANCDIAGQCANIGAGTPLSDAFFQTPGAIRPTAGDTYNYAPVNYLMLPQERFTLGGFADYEFTPGHRAYTEVFFANNRVQQELAPTPITGTASVNINAVAPFLDPATLAAFQQVNANQQAADAQRVANGLAPLFTDGLVRGNVLRRINETGNRNSFDERSAFRALVGMTGEITNNINYDVYYSYARTRNANVQSGNISRSAFNNALAGVTTPINIFGPGTLTPEMVQQIAIQAQNGDISRQEVAAATISGFAGNLGLGGGDIGFVLGAEYRSVGARFIPDTALASGDVVGFNAGEATAGGYDVKELFAEVDIPIFETDAGMRLSVNGAGRYSDYSLDAIGGVWTYAGGVQFSPYRDLTFRGQYQRAIRAPNVAELFGGQAIGFPGATDPCGDPGFLSANPGAGAFCVATGVPVASVGNASAIQLNPQIPALFGGNPNLREETSTSWTAGAAFTPSFIPGLTITADYFDIKVDNFITVAGGGLQGLLNLCYGVAQDVNSPLCQPFVGVRNASGQIDVDNPPLVAGVNAASFRTAGVDLMVNYDKVLGFGLFGGDNSSRFNFNILGTWTTRSDFTPVSGLPDVNECAGRFGGECLNGGQPIPRFKSFARASWIDGPLTTSLRWRHLSGTRDADDANDFAAFNGIERIGSYDLFDLTFGLDVSERLTFTFGINNLFDTLPGTPRFNPDGTVANRPNSLLLGDNQEQANTFPSVFDVLGRDFFIAVNLRF